MVSQGQTPAGQEPQAPPKNTLHLLWMIIKGMIKNIPKIIIRLIIISVLSFAFVYAVNTYVIAFVGNGWAKPVPPGSPWYWLWNLGDNQAAFTALAFFVFYVLSTLIQRLFDRGIKTFFSDLYQFPGYTIRCFTKAKKNALGSFLLGVGIALIAALFQQYVRNTYLMLTFAFGILLTFTMREQSFTHLFVDIFSKDMQRTFKKPQQGLNPYSISAFLFGIFGGVVLLMLLPGQPTFPVILGVVCIVLTVLLSFNLIKPKTAVTVLVFGFIAGVISAITTNVWAHDGGWAEAGGTWDGWYNSPGAREVRQSGRRPGVFGTIGGFFGGLFTAGANAVTGAGRYIGNKAYDGAAYVGRQSARAARAVTSTLSDAVDYVTVTATDVYDRAMGHLRDGAGYVYDRAVDAADWASEQLGRGYDWTVDRVADGMEWAYDRASDAYDWASDRFNDAYDWASDQARSIADTIVDAASYAALFTTEFGKAVWDDIKGLGSDLVSLPGQVVDWAGRTVTGIGEFMSDVWQNPNILLDGAVNTVVDLVKLPFNIASGIYNTVTNPSKMWEFAKDAVGYNNFVNSVDPNRSLLERLGNTAAGVFKLGSTLATAGKAGTAIKQGSTRAVGSANQMLNTYRTSGVRGVMNDVRGLFGGKTTVTPAARIPQRQMTIKPGTNYRPSGRPADLSSIPTSSQKTMQHVANEMGVQIHVRPANSASRALIESKMAVPKPMAIKSKTINSLDELIGAPRNSRGLVGHFDPKLPSQSQLSQMTPDMRNALQRRFVERKAEFAKYNPDMQRLSSSGQYNVQNGVVRDMRVGKPVAGDVDLFDIRSFDGKPLPQRVQQQVVDRLQSFNSGGTSLSNVEHSAVTMWDATDPGFSAAAKHKMLRAAEHTDGVITFNPMNNPTHNYLLPGNY